MVDKEMNKVNIIRNAKFDDYVHSDYCMLCGEFTKVCSGTVCCKKCDGVI